MFFGGNFQLWKLHTAADYLSFFLFLLAGIGGICRGGKMHEPPEEP